MLVGGLVFADQEPLDGLTQAQAPEQVVNVAFLPGIQHASLGMPDIRWGYGFCIGGVCATDPDEGGVISPGGVGYDINCLSAEPLILTAFGYSRPIGEMVRGRPGGAGARSSSAGGGAEGACARPPVASAPRVRA